MNNQPPTEEDAILIGVRTADVLVWATEESLAELAELTRTAGGRVVKSIVQARAAPDSAYFIGRGKATSLIADVDEWEADLVVFDCELSPARQRNQNKES